MSFAIVLVVSLCAAVSSAHTHILHAGRLSVHIDEDDLSYSVTVDDETWFDSSGDSLGYSYSNSNKTYYKNTLTGTILPSTHGTDTTGEYVAASIGWKPAANKNDENEWITEFRAYPSRNALVFKQIWSSPSILTFISLSNIFISSSLLSIINYS